MSLLCEKNRFPHIILYTQPPNTILITNDFDIHDAPGGITSGEQLLPLPCKILFVEVNDQKPIDLNFNPK
jgi:hypothetical protein